MLNFIRNFLLRNGLFLFISTINFVYLAPIYTSYTAMNNSDGQTNLVLSRENHTNISTILYPKDIHLLKVRNLFFWFLNEGRKSTSTLMLTF